MSSSVSSITQTTTRKLGLCLFSLIPAIVVLLDQTLIKKTIKGLVEINQIKKERKMENHFPSGFKNRLVGGRHPDFLLARRWKGHGQSISGTVVLRVDPNNSIVEAMTGESVGSEETQFSFFSFYDFFYR